MSTLSLTLLMAVPVVPAHDTFVMKQWIVKSKS